MHVKAIVAEDFVNYKRPSMFISTCICNWKCCVEQGLDIGVCQNSPLSKAKTIEVDDSIIYENFKNNPIPEAVVIGGLEPFMQFEEVLSLIKVFRENGENCPFIIYTGYYPEEISNYLKTLREFPNIIIKFGRYVPDDNPRFDEVLGISLASSNQYAEKIS